MTSALGRSRYAYRSIVADVRERIALGEFDATGALDSESALCARYGVSRPTVRKALDLLRSQGLVESRQGAGWFVVSVVFRQKLALGTFRHASSAVVGAGKSLTREVLEFGFRPVDPALAVSLGIAASADALYVRSRRTVEGEGFDITHEWVPAPRAYALSRADAVDPGLWASLAHQGHPIAAVRQTVTAGAATDLDAATLGTDVGTPVLLIRRLALAADGAPVALADHRYLAHRFALEIDFNSAPDAASDGPPGLYAVSATSYRPTDTDTDTDTNTDTNTGREQSA